MEVASPLPFSPAPTGQKRNLTCSPQCMDSSSCSLEIDGADQYRTTKRRRFHGDMSVDSLSESFSSHSPFFQNAIQASKKSVFSNINNNSNSNAALLSLKRNRGGSSSPVNVKNDLTRVVEEQSAAIESLKADKQGLQTELSALKTDYDRSQKENNLLRRAVGIQQDRQKHADSQLRAAEEYRVGAEEKIRKLEHLVLALRYHLQTQQNNVVNDFMGRPPFPPDVY